MALDNKKMRGDVYVSSITCDVLIHFTMSWYIATKE